jgi:carboxyl-terminal processing protease
MRPLYFSRRSGGCPRSRMSLRRLSVQSVLLLQLLIVPATSFGASPLPADGTATVSRGDFLKAAITQLSIPHSAKALPTGDYTRAVPRALQSYVSAAEKQKALTPFGSDLGLGRTITRGEAATLVTLLLHLQPTDTHMSFSDVKAKTAMERGVRVVVERDWMQPVKPTLFGAARSLTSAEAQTLLNKASGKQNNPEMGPSSQTKTPSVTVQYKTTSSSDLPESAMLRTLWQLVEQQYLYTDKIQDKEAAYRAAEGLINSLGDPYTVFMRPVDAEQFQSQIDGQVSGIGAQVEYVDNALTVIAPITGSPAQKAGLRPGDRITEVDGKSLAGLNLIQAVDKIRGPKGTDVTLTIIRDGSEIEVTLKRDTVRLPEIDISMQDGIAVVRLVQFGQTTDTQLRALMADVQTKKPKGVVLDLRNNPGGLLHAAEITLSNFLPEGSAVAVIKSKTDEFTEVTSDAPTIDEDIPMVVLMNKGSASASEIVAGALQDHKRAVIVGETSFGKGTVQQIIEFKDGSSVKMTIAEWLTPKSRAINKVGIEPDVPVKSGDGTRDEQLLKALDLLR